MIGEFYDRPREFDTELRKRDLKLAAFAYSAASGFTDANCWEEDLAGALKAIEFVRDFPEPRLGLGGAAHPERENVWEKLDQATKLYNRIGREAAVAGISINVHPHSHFGSLLESAEEYQYLLDHLGPTNVSFGPDTGHIVRGGQDLLACLQTHMPRITHLHFKDATLARDWVPLGDGVCDYPAVMRLLESVGYDGWVVGEEESEAARLDGVAAIRKNRAYLRSIGY